MNESREHNQSFEKDPSVLQKQRISRSKVNSIQEVSVSEEESKQAKSSSSKISIDSEVMRQIEDDKF